MKKIFNNYIIALAALFFVASCAPSFDELEVRTSTADFTKYIAIGNSLTAGFADGGLYLEGQHVAYPNLIAAQMQQVGGGAFTSPFFSEDQANGSGYLRLSGFDERGNPETESVTTNLAIRSLNPLLYTKYEGAEYHNYGVPGMRLDLAFVPPFGRLNPYFERLLETGTEGGISYFDFTRERDHTFFSFWLGNNDVLGYAMNGAVVDPNPLRAPITALTNIQTFTGAYNNYITALTTGDRKGVVATIPDVTSIPFFNTITQPLLVAAVRAEAGNNNLEIFIQTKTSPPRPATPEDLFFLNRIEGIGVPNAQGIPFGLHPLNPIPDNMVLDRDEVAEVKAIINQYNAVIRQAAESRDLALVDMHAFFNQVRNGVVLSSIPFNTQFIRGNAFSLDGIHLTPIGNAVVANVFIDAINKKYNASIPRVDITQYSGVRMPN